MRGRARAAKGSGAQRMRRRPGGPLTLRGDDAKASLFMFTALLFAHAWLRWAVVVALAYAIVRLVTKGGDDGRADLRAALPALIACDLQLLVGLVLHLAASPLVAAAMADPAAAMKDGTLRYFFVEHPVTMLIAIATVHVGRVLGKGATTGDRRQRLLLGTSVAALVLVLLRSPWLSMGRPLFRLG